MAVFTLPPELMILYKPNIDFVASHAVDPDKRRYASEYEAVRHYIDLDVWGKPPFDTLPKTWLESMIKFSNLEWQSDHREGQRIAGLEVWSQAYSDDTVHMQILDSHLSAPSDLIRQFYAEKVLPGYYSDHWFIPKDTLISYFDWSDIPSLLGVRIEEDFTTHGILPYHLLAMQRKLTNAFLEGDVRKIISCSADFGHYIGDAHVPLHTTKNYNGQLTDQLGIHAFWESRIPELFAEKEYDFFTGKASYIEDPLSYYWNIVFASHTLVDTVLMIEKSLSERFPSDQQYCFDERLDVTTRLPCKEYARAYQAMMNGMVEDRMRQSIMAIGNAWFTAWVDAGQPEFGYAEALSSSETIRNDVLPESRPVKHPRRIHE